MSTNSASFAVRDHAIKYEVLPTDTSIQKDTNTKVSDGLTVLLCDLKQLFPAQSREQISKSDYRCIASTKQPAGQRCTRRLNRNNDAKTQLQTLIQSLELEDNGEMIACLRKLAEATLCGRSHKDLMDERLQKLEKFGSKGSTLHSLREWLRGLFLDIHKPSKPVDAEHKVHEKRSHETTTVKAEQSLEDVEITTKPRLSPSTPSKALSRPKPTRRIAVTELKQKRKASTLVPSIDPKRNHKLTEAWNIDSPIVLSPTDSVYDSPDEKDEIFDAATSSSLSPERNESVTTPITPPTVGVTKHRSSQAAESPLAHKSTQSFKIDKANYFPEIGPGKLIRNMTVEIQRISQECRVPGQEDYCIVPNPHFSIQESLRYTIIQRDVNKKAVLRSAQNIQETVARKPSAISIETKGQPQIMRVKLTPAGNFLERIIPYDVQRRLSKRDMQCVASKNDQFLAKCTSKAKGSSAIALSALEDIIQTYTNKMHTLLANKIERFATEALCGTHYNVAMHDKRIGKLGNLFESLANNKSNQMTKRHTPLDRTALEEWISAISKILDHHPQTVKEEPIVKLGSNSAEPLVRSQDGKISAGSTIGEHIRARKGVATKHAEFSSSPLPYIEHFSPYKLKRPKTITAVAAKPLSPLDLKSGYIYLFWLPGNFGLLKIGMTSKTMESRLQRWNDKCKRKHEYHAACFNEHEMIEIPHVHRVEQLIHTELAEFRMTSKCTGCGAQHKEWFKVSGDHALNVYCKWRDWIRGSPYMEDSEGNSVLKSEFRDKLAEIYQPVKAEKQTKATRNARKNTGRKSQRRKSKN